MDKTSHNHPDFVKEREAEGRQDFEVIIRGMPDIHLTPQEVGAALYDLLKAKADAIEGDGPYFDIETNTRG